LIALIALMLGLFLPLLPDYMDTLKKAVARPLLLQALALFPDVKGAAQVHNVACYVNAQLRDAGFEFTLS